mmetsp:Transcript_103687/g.299914  ORF Transcript_103687/g.299914 Transcript_103687/m.299914 type:complete len:124 (-) Transcript_103687:963-1334(-)
MFNQPLGSWNVRAVMTMYEMFRGASSFNQPLDSWNVQRVTNMVGMFLGAFMFDQNLCMWDSRLPPGAALNNLLLRSGCELQCHPGNSEPLASCRICKQILSLSNFRRPTKISKKDSLLSEMSS